MADNPNFDSTNFRRTREEAQAISAALDSVNESIKDTNKELRLAGLTSQTVTTEFRKIKTIASEVSNLQQEIVASTKGAVETEKAQRKILAQVVNLETKSASLLKQANEYREKALGAEQEVIKLKAAGAKENSKALRAAIATRDNAQLQDRVLRSQAQNIGEAAISSKALADSYGEMVDDALKLDSQTSFFGALSNIVSDIPGLRALAGPFQDAARAARQTAFNNEANIPLLQEILDTGKGLTAETIKRLGLEKELVDENGKLLTGRSGLQKIRSKGGTAILKQQNTLVAGGKAFLQSSVSAAASFLRTGGIIGVILIALQKIKKLFIAIDGRTSEIANNLNISKQAAAELQLSTLKTGENVNLLTSRLGAATEMMSKFASTTGLTSYNTEVLNQDLEETARLIGLSDEQMTNLAVSLTAFGGSTKEFRDSFLQAADSMEASYGVAFTTQAVFKDMADTTNLQRLNLQMNAEELGKSVVAARRLGLNLSAIENISNSMLDFESSIRAEIEAELFLGRELNLERARSAALQNDYLTVAEEVARNIGSAADFAKMNRIQQEGLAKAVGLTVDDLADVLTLEQAAADAGFTSAKQAQDRLEILQETMGFAEGIAQFQKEYGDAQGAAFTRLQASQSVQSKINMLLENAKTIFMTALAPTVAKIATFLEDNADSLQRMVGQAAEFTTGFLSGGKEADNFRKILSETSDIVGAITTGMRVLVELTKMALAPFKATVNIAKGLGNLVASGFNFVKGGDKARELSQQQFNAAKSNYAAAAGDVLDAASGIPNALLAAVGEDTIKNPIKTQDDFISRPGQGITSFRKDDIIVGGTNLLGGSSNQNVEALLERIASAIESGGDVYIDGNRAGKAMVLASHKLS